MPEIVSEAGREVRRPRKTPATPEGLHREAASEAPGHGCSTPTLGLWFASVSLRCAVCVPGPCDSVAPRLAQEQPAVRAARPPGRAGWLGGSPANRSLFAFRPPAPLPMGARSRLMEVDNAYK